jgi:hypothetical protein
MSDINFHSAPTEIDGDTNTDGIWARTDMDIDRDWDRDRGTGTGTWTRTWT